MGLEQRMVVMGDTRYRVEPGWGRLPTGQALGPVSQVAVDSRGHVYVFQRANPPVLVFDRSGEFVDTLAQDRILDAHGIFIDHEDRVHLVDRDAHQILSFDAQGELLGTLGVRHRPQLGAPFNHPTAIAVARDGERYVADGYGNSHVHRYSAEGEHVSSWGGAGIGPGEFSTPHGVWVDRSDRVLVIDRENNRVQIFDREGRYLDEWRDLYHPMDFYEDAAGRVFVSDQTPRVTLFSPGGKLLGRSRPSLNGAHGIWGSPTGELFLAEMSPNRVTRLVPAAETAGARSPAAG
ncbi:MAG: peptidyl-alpha-hydroxyglycine alpha-amidating lyase family protein [Gammaproteobacteria bacterium]